MLAQQHLPLPLTSTVRWSLFTHVHSSPLFLAARLRRCHTNRSRYINSGGTSPGEAAHVQNHTSSRFSTALTALHVTRCLLSPAFNFLCFQFTLYWFQVYSIVVRQSYTLQSVPSDIFNTHLTPYVVMTVLLTPFPMLYFTALSLPVCTSESLHLFTQSPKPPPLWQPPVCCLCL